MKVLLIIFLLTIPVYAQEPVEHQSTPEQVADVLSWVTVGSTILGQVIDTLDDPEKACKFKRQALATGLTVGIAEAIKYFVHKNRPDNSDDNSFPSEHTALAFANTGWRIAYSISLGVGTGAGRVLADKHDWIDVSVGAGLGTGMKLLSDKVIKCP